MAITVTRDIDTAERIGNSRLGILTGNIALDSSYPTDGYALTDIAKYFTSILSLQVEGEGGYGYAFDKANERLLVYYPSGSPVLSGASASASANYLSDGQSRFPSIYQRLTPTDLMTTETEVTWTTLAINDTVVLPSGTDQVLLRIGIDDNTVGSYIAVRDPDVGAGRGKVGYCYVQEAGVPNWRDIIQAVPATGANGQKFDYAVGDAGGSGPISSYCHITILGYWRYIINIPNVNHTHNVGTYVNAAEAADEVTNGVDLSGVTLLTFVAHGIINVP